MPGQVPPCLHAAFEHCAARVPLDGRPVECEHDANCSLVRVSLWSHFPRFLATLAAKSLQQNPLRQRLDRWCVWGFGAPDFFMVHRTLLWGAPVCALGQRPDAVPPPCNHASVYEQGATSIVHQQLCEKVESGLLLRFSGSRVQQLKPYGFLDHVHPMGAVPKMEGSKIAGYRIVQDYSFPLCHALCYSTTLSCMPLQGVMTSDLCRALHGRRAVGESVAGLFGSITRSTCLLSWTVWPKIWRAYSRSCISSQRRRH